MRRNRTDSWLILVLLDFALGMAYLIVILIVALLVAGHSRAAETPTIPPYRIPTFDGRPHDFRAPVPAMAPAPRVDSDAVFRAVVNCFPERVRWGLELDAVAGIRESSGGVSTFDTSGLARHYVGIVARMPLYSATEINRERAEEYKRRQEVAQQVARLLEGLADRRRAQRELGLYSSLEARSQKRVALGLVSVDEQVGYLEKVAQAQASLDAANARIEGARLALAGQCRDGVADEVNAYLKEITR